MIKMKVFIVKLAKGDQYTDHFIIYGQSYMDALSTLIRNFSGKIEAIYDPTLPDNIIKYKLLKSGYELYFNKTPQSQIEGFPRVLLDPPQYFNRTDTLSFIQNKFNHDQDN